MHSYLAAGIDRSSYCNGKAIPGETILPESIVLNMSHFAAAEHLTMA